MKYAQIDPAKNTKQQVIGWFDTEFAKYTQDFTKTDFISVSDTDWDSRTSTPYYDPATKTFSNVPPAPTLAEAKGAKMAELKAAFQNAMATGHFTLSLGWDIDCRRSGKDNDESNMEGLLQIAKKKGLVDTAQIDTNGIKGYDNQWHPATVADVRDTIIPEMCEYGASLYQKKFQLQAQVDAITLASGSDGSAEIAKVNAIAWS